MVDHILEMARVEERLVSPEELNLPPADEPAAAKLEFAPAAEADTEVAESGGEEPGMAAEVADVAAPEAERDESAAHPS